LSLLREIIFSYPSQGNLPRAFFKITSASLMATSSTQQQQQQQQQCFQLLSDLHLEFYRDKPARLDELIQTIAANPHAPYLLLAGDLGYPHEASYHDALAAWSPAFKHICVIAGNHEFYCLPGTPRRSYTAILEQARSVCAHFPNVSFLHDSHVDLPMLPPSSSESTATPILLSQPHSHIRIIGTPLW
jgi:hypothetical protein